MDVNLYQTLSMAVLFLCLACGTSDEFPEVSAGEQADIGRALDAAGSLDVEVGTEFDAEPDGAIDAEFDAAIDAEPDTAMDADLDSGSDPDAMMEGLCADGMVVIPPGDFLQGALGMEMYLEGFCIDRTEVSAQAFLECVADGACDGYENWQFCTEERANRPHQCNDEKLDYPANWIDWYRAHQYCVWKGGLLPTAFQWEKAARGIAGQRFPWGDEITCADAHFARGEFFDRCQGFGELPDDIVAVDTYLESESPYGAINMAGNVKEWVDFRIDRTILPTEAESGLTRGGAWQDGEDALLVFTGDTRIGPAVTSRDHGFRCVSDLLP